MVEVGKFYTMSKMKHTCGDRSYLEHIWEVKETNGTHALIQKVCPPKKGEHKPFGYAPVLVAVCEFDFTEATVQMVKTAQLIDI